MLFSKISLHLSLCLTLSAATVSAQQTPPAKPQAPAADEWGEDFSGTSLNEKNWERFTFEGGSGGTLVLTNGQMQMRSVSGARAGVRSKPEFKSDHFIINARLPKVGPGLPEPGRPGPPLGNALVTILFDSSGRNRVEWLLTSEGMFEAWAIVDGREEGLDGRNLATKATNPSLSIARRGDEFLFALNGQVGLQKTVKNLPRSFRIMLYGYGSSENNWDALQVLITKKQ